ncbi:aldo/keto reductase [Salinarimonas chemoclinalis]|uniref:aldo/keto reductase n=1 Tax=Salinarimonas chemoclinalis TaxID=3241599 RepID=UPI00355933C2
MPADRAPREPRARFAHAHGVRLPLLGYGTSRRRGDACRLLVEEALRIGYRLIDTAEVYDNEAAVGRAIAASRVPRGEIVLCTKAHPQRLLAGAPTEALERSLERLRAPFVDLFLMHWPCALADLPRAMERLAAARESGLARAVGLANAPASFLSAARSRLPEIAVDQVERHLLLQQPRLVATLRRSGVILMAYRPTARGAAAAPEPVRTLARTLGQSAHQIALRWHLEQRGVVAIAGASSVEQLRENLASLDFALGAAAMASLATLDEGRRTLSRDYAPDWPEDRVPPQARGVRGRHEPSASPKE